MANEYMYCVKCRKKVFVDSPKEVTFKNKRTKQNMRALQGNCPRCGTKTFKILGKAK